MKKSKLIVIVLLIIVAIISSHASAEGNSYIQCDCFPGRCECFIQLGDEGGAVKRIVEVLIDKKYLPKKTPKGKFSEEVEIAVKQFQTDNNLEPTGTMDDDTLTLLLWDMLPEQLDEIDGGLEKNCRTVYLPTDGGKKRHRKETCSRMEDPWKVSDRNAEKLGFDECGKCYK